MRQCSVCQEIVEIDVNCATANCPFDQSPKGANAGPGTTGRADEAVQSGLDRLDEGTRAISRRILLFALALGAIAVVAVIGGVWFVSSNGHSPAERKPSADQIAQVDGGAPTTRQDESADAIPTAAGQAPTDAPDAALADSAPDNAANPVASTSQPSFDCTKASTAAERLICSNTELGELDAQLMTAYRELVRSFPRHREEIQAGQRDWLLKERNRCTEVACMTGAYHSRRDGLDALVEYYSDIDLGQ